MTRATFEGTFTGQQIIDAVKAAAGDDYIEQNDYDDGPVVTVGQRSGYPYKHIIVRADGGDTIRADAEYSKVSVENHSWGGSVYAVGYGQDSVIKAVVSFRDKLKEDIGSA